MALSGDSVEKAKEALAKFKAAWGIIGDKLDVQLASLLNATGGNPTIEQIQQVLRGALLPSAIDAIVLQWATELKEALTTGKSVPKRNRSALA